MNKLIKAICLFSITAVIFCNISCYGGSEGMAMVNKSKVELPRVDSIIGEGLIYFNLNHPLPLFATEYDTAAYDTLKFVEVKSGPNKGKGDFKTYTLGNRLIPYEMNVGDSDVEAKRNVEMGLIRFRPYLIFRVIKKMDNAIVVLINEETKESSVIKIDDNNNIREEDKDGNAFFDPNFVDSKNDNWFFYETWPQALMRAFLISLPKDLPIFDQPNGKQIALAKQETNFRVLAVEGNWARISNEPYHYEGDKLLDAWVKWHDQGKMNIHLMLNGGYE